MMRKSVRLTLLCMLTMLAVACAACASGKGSEPQTAAELQEQETSEMASEGVDTPCEVSFFVYTGDHSEMFLHQGDSIAVISPSSLPSQKQVDATVAGLESWGYVPVKGQHVCEPERTLQDCLDDLAWALEDPEIRAIFCVRGGYGASEVADALPASLVKDSGKLIVGYSDITVLHSAWTSAGLPSIHSCMSGTFDGLPEACVDAERRLLAGEVPSYTCEASELCRAGEAEGLLIGGNLSTFTSVLGTAYDCTKTDKPFILFLEDVGEDIRHLHRYLTVLKHLGVLDKAAGIVFGEWTELPATETDYAGNSRGGAFESVGDMISRQIVADLDIPIAYGFPAGHGDVNYPLLMGTPARLSVGAGSYTLTWS